jgi:hypothetical protein
MKLTFGEKQPYRVWYQYLQTCLNDKELSKKVNRTFYKEWHLNRVKTEKFDKWLKDHEHLFVDSETQMRIFKGTRKPNTVLLEVPLNYSITQAQRELGKVLDDKLNKRLSKYAVTSTRGLLLPQLDYYLYMWQTKAKHKDNITSEEIWGIVYEYVQTRQAKVRTLVKQGKLRGRFLMGEITHDKKYNINKGVMISKNLRKCNRILNNVCNGTFPGDFALK